MEDKLKLLALAKDFTITELDDGRGYDVSYKYGNVIASIDFTNSITYYLDGCYNSGSDLIQIDIEELLKLKEFCESLIK